MCRAVLALTMPAQATCPLLSSAMLWQLLCESKPAQQHCALDPQIQHVAGCGVPCMVVVCGCAWPLLPFEADQVPAGNFVWHLDGT